MFILMVLYFSLSIGVVKCDDNSTTTMVVTTTTTTTASPLTASLSTNSAISSFSFNMPTEAPPPLPTLQPIPTTPSRAPSNNATTTITDAEQMEKTTIIPLPDVKLDTNKQFSSSSTRQTRFISMLRSSLYSLRFFIQNLLKTYRWYNPELKLGGCVVRYTRAQYPDLMRTTLSYENVSRFVYGLYGTIYGYINNMIDENRQEIMVERERIGNKILELTSDDLKVLEDVGVENKNTMSSFANLNTENFNLKPSAVYTVNNNNLRRHRRQQQQDKLNSKKNNKIPKEITVEETRRMDSSNQMDAKLNPISVDGSMSADAILKKSLAVAPRQIDFSESDNIISYGGPRQLSADYQHMTYPPSLLQPPHQSMPIFNTVPDLAVPTNNEGNEFITTDDHDEDNGENLFDFENIILQMLGLNSKMAKSNSLVRCTQSYVLHFMERTFEHFLASGL